MPCKCLLILIWRGSALCGTLLQGCAPPIAAAQVCTLIHNHGRLTGHLTVRLQAAAPGGSKREYMVTHEWRSAQGGSQGAPKGKIIQQYVNQWVGCSTGLPTGRLTGRLTASVSLAKLEKKPRTRLKKVKMCDSGLQKVKFLCRRVSISKAFQ